MKKYFIFLIIIPFLSSCENEYCVGGCPIEYNETGAYGQNLLFGEEDLTIPLGSYSFQAKRHNGGSFKVVLTAIHGDGIWFYNMNQTGWTINTLESDPQTGDPTKQSFELKNSGDFDLDLSFPMMSGTILVEYYENDNAVTKSKKIFWG